MNCPAWRSSRSSSSGTKKSLNGSPADATRSDSAFNATELETLGYGCAGVFPLYLDFKRLRAAYDNGLKLARK